VTTASLNRIKTAARVFGASREFTGLLRRKNKIKTMKSENNQQAESKLGFLE